MLLTSSLLALAVQVGPNPQTIQPGDGHAELRERLPREEVIASPDSEVSRWSNQCLDLLAQDASRAHTMAQIKRNESTGIARVVANHCLGLAATELELWDDAAGAFRAARDEAPDDQPSARSRFGIMAGNAVLASGDAQRAVLLLDLAKEEASRASNATLEAIAATDLARAMVAAEMPEPALAELARASALQPDNPESWLLRATLLRRLDRLAEAQTAIEQAGTLAPRDTLIGLEAGVIAVLSGREDAARASWQSVIEVDPGSPEALTAQTYIDQLGPPGTPPTP
ncbi:MAG: tetratricopeptide repeat protein [Erythrobacter sp.]